MLDDSSRSLETKDRFRQGNIGVDEFARVMGELRRTGTDRIERRGRRNAVGAVTALAGPSASATAATPGLTVPNISSAPVGAEPWHGRDKGADGSRFSDLGHSGLKLKRPAHSSGVLSKLGVRLVAGLTTASLKADEASGSNSGQGSSPVVERARSEAGGVRRLRSPRRGSIAVSPRHHQREPGTNESGDTAGSGSWRPWSVPGNPSRRLVSSASSPERPAPSPAGTGTATPVKGGALPQGKQTLPPSTHTQRGEVGVDGGSGGDGSGGGTGSATGSAPPGPLTASEIDNMSSVSTTSTVLTDLSSRMEKIEDLLTRLLEESIESRGGGGSDVLLRRWGHAGQRHGGGGGQDNDTGSSGGGSGTGGIARAPETRPSSNVPNEESAGELMVVVKDTAAELRQVRGRLRQLELEEAAAKAAKAAGAGSSTTPPAPASVAPRSSHPPNAVDAGATSGVGGDQSKLGGGPASELPDEGELLQVSSAVEGKQAEAGPPSSNNAAGAASVAGAGPSRWPTPSAHIGHEDEPDEAVTTVPNVRSSAGGPEHPSCEPELSRQRRYEEGEEKGVGMGGSGGEDETMDQIPDGGDPLKGVGRSRTRSFGLSPISEAPV